MWGAGGSRWERCLGCAVPAQQHSGASVAAPALWCGVARRAAWRRPPSTLVWLSPCCMLNCPPPSLPSPHTPTSLHPFRSISPSLKCDAPSPIAPPALPAWMCVLSARAATSCRRTALAVSGVSVWALRRRARTWGTTQGRGATQGRGDGEARGRLLRRPRVGQQRRGGRVPSPPTLRLHDAPTKAWEWILA